MRNHVDLCARANRHIVLHELIEKRYALRPYGWPDNEVLLLLARLLVLGDINLMMDGALLPLDKVYEAITTPAKRRKIIVVKRQTANPEAIKNARNLGKELFAEMGPDSEDGLFSFLQGKLKYWQTSLTSYKTLADTGNYPGREEIADGLTLINKPLTDKESPKFIDRFNTLRKDLIDFAERYHDLEHFYEHQKPTWEKLRRATEKFNLNSLYLERDAQAGAALRLMNEILAASAPYGLLKDTDGLITTVDAVNSALLTGRRKQATEKIDGHYATLTKEIATVQGDAGLRVACLKPLELLRQQVEREESLAHITQAEAEAIKEFDAAIARIEEFVKKAAAKPPAKGTATPLVVKKQRIIKASDFMKATYLETPEDVNAFLDALRQELQKALANGERIQIR